MLFKPKKQEPIIIVAEAGINHGGNINQAIDLIHAAKQCGADAVKFQYYLTEVLCADRNCYEAYDILKKNETKGWWLPELKKECDKVGIRFFCTAFCKSTAEELNPYVSEFKVASPETRNINFLKHLERYGKPLVLSCGKVTSDELDIIFDTIKVPISLLICVSKYPALPSEYNLEEINKLRNKYKCQVGVSCHCVGIKNAIDAALKYNAAMIEKHFMLEDMDCVDKSVSITPNEFAKMVKIIRQMANL